MDNPHFFETEHNRMISEQLERRGLHSPRLLQAFRQVPRHIFVPPDQRHLAYADCPLPIGEHQTISQPYIVALMTHLLSLQGDENVLEIGTGSGYQAAILGYLARQVHTIERHPALAERARLALAEVGADNVTVHIGDGSRGLAEYAPYHGILVTAAAPQVPRELLNQLEDGGRLVLPVGSRSGQILERWHRHGERFDSDAIAPVAFVPLIGDQGWREGDWDLS